MTVSISPRVLTDSPWPATIEIGKRPTLGAAATLGSFPSVDMGIATVQGTDTNRNEETEKADV